MKSRIGLVAGVLLSALSVTCSSSPSAVAAKTDSSQDGQKARAAATGSVGGPLKSGWRVGPPQSFGNLTLFPVISEESINTDEFITLDEALRSGKVIVAESGIKTHQEIKDLKSWGAHAVLIGETFLTAPNPAQKIKEVMYG